MLSFVQEVPLARQVVGPAKTRRIEARIALGRVYRILVRGGDHWGTVLFADGDVGYVFMGRTRHGDPVAPRPTEHGNLCAKRTCSHLAGVDGFCESHEGMGPATKWEFRVASAEIHHRPWWGTSSPPEGCRHDARSARVREIRIRMGLHFRRQ